MDICYPWIIVIHACQLPNICGFLFQGIPSYFNSFNLKLSKFVHDTVTFSRH